MMDLLLVVVACVLVWCVLSRGWELGYVTCCLVTLTKGYNGQPHKHTGCTRCNVAQTS